MNIAMNRKLLLFALAIAFVGCQKDALIEPKTAIVEETSKAVLSTWAAFEWEVDYPGMVSSRIWLSTDRDMRDSFPSKKSMRKPFVIFPDVHGITIVTRYIILATAL